MASRETSGGVGIGMVLFLIFLVLKLTDTIDWSWWWVTSPLWIPVVLSFIFLIIIFFLVFLAILFGLSPEKIENKISKFKDKL